MAFQDIQISDVNLLNKFTNYWNNSQYQDAIDLLNNSQLNSKWASAILLNAMTQKLVEIQEFDDPTFDGKKPTVSPTQPENPDSEIPWFQITHTR